MILTRDNLGIWYVYKKGNSVSYPPKYGTYLVYRAGCDKMSFQVWNGTGWAYDGNDITHFSIVQKPSK